MTGRSSRWGERSAEALRRKQGYMSQDLKAECGWSATNKETDVEKWREQYVRIGEQDIQAAETWRGGPSLDCRFHLLLPVSLESRMEYTLSQCLLNQHMKE